MKPQTFESFLQDKFVGLREVGGVPIIKDNAEDMFDSWLANRDVNEIMDFAEDWGITVREEVLKKFEPAIEMLKKINNMF